jgi:protein-S-isoprenylcysteine O-methyltransferase Ste14
MRTSAAVLFIGWCVLHVRGFDPYLGLVFPIWTKALGIVLLGLGGIAVLMSGKSLSTSRIGTRDDRLFPKEFVASGPFRYVRNPMSLGAVTLMFGLGLYVGSASVLVAGLLLFLIFHMVVIYGEEPGLEKRFGESYKQYKQSVNRWLPKF